MITNNFYCSKIITNSLSCDKWLQIVSTVMNDY
jgi:hypothetical protein